MNNEGRILAILETMQAEQKITNDRLLKLETNVSEMKTDISAIKDDIEAIKEDSAEIRVSSNALLDWAERSESVTKVKLFPNVNRG